MQPAFSTRAPTLWAGMGDNCSFALALPTGDYVDEAAEETLLDTLYLSSAIAGGTSGGLGAWLAACAMAE